MKPEDVNKLNKRNNTIQKVYKYCPKCNQTRYVSCYVSKCPICKTPFENIIQPNVPRCPTCNSTNIKKISSLNRVAHGYAFGLFSKTARSQFCCQNCGYKWQCVLCFNRLTSVSLFFVPLITFVLRSSYTKVEDKISTVNLTVVLSSSERIFTQHRCI